MKLNDRKISLDLTPYCIGLALLLLTIDKIFGMGWSWWTITSPIWFPFALIAIPVALAMLVFLFYWIFYPEKIVITHKGKVINK